MKKLKIILIACAAAFIQIALSGYFLYIGIATNYSSQQIDNWLYGNNYSSSSGAGIYNASDSTLSVRLKSSAFSFVKTQPEADTAFYWIKDTVAITDTVRIKNHFKERFKFNVIANNTTYDTLQVAMNSNDYTGVGFNQLLNPNESFSSDYFDAVKDSLLFLHNGDLTAGKWPGYRLTMQGR